MHHGNTYILYRKPYCQQTNHSFIYELEKLTKCSLFERFRQLCSYTKETYFQTIFLRGTQRKFQSFFLSEVLLSIIRKKKPNKLYHAQTFLSNIMFLESEFDKTLLQFVFFFNLFV